VFANRNNPDQVFLDYFEGGFGTFLRRLHPDQSPHCFCDASLLANHPALVFIGDFLASG